MDWKVSNRSDPSSTLLIVGRAENDEESERLTATLRAMADHYGQKDVFNRITPLPGKNMVLSMCHNFQWHTHLHKPYFNDATYTFLAHHLERLRLLTLDPERFSKQSVANAKIDELVEMTRDIHTKIKSKNKCVIIGKVFEKQLSEGLNL